MRLTGSSIQLNDVRLYAYHGVLEQERRVGGEYSVSLCIHYNIYKAMQSDDVSDTVNYAVLLDIIRRQMARPSALLEHVAGRIAQQVFDEFPEVEAADLTITKLNPPMGSCTAGAGVTLHLINDKTQG